MVAIVLGRPRRLSVPAAVRAAAGRLPDDPGADALSGREPGGDEPDGDRAARAPVRPDAGTDAHESTSAAGVSIVTLQFGLGLTLDVAEQEVQAAINAGGSLLPADLPAPPVYAKVNPADAPVLTLAVTSDTLPLTEVRNLVNTRLAQKISQVAGVGLVTLSGGQRPAVRIQADTRGAGVDTGSASTAAHRDHRRPTRTAPRAASTGRRAPTRSTPTTSSHRRRLQEPDRRLPQRRAGAPERRRRHRRGRREREARRVGEHGEPAIILDVQRQPGANVIATVDAIKAQLPDCRRRCRPRSTWRC